MTFSVNMKRLFQGAQFLLVIAVFGLVLWSQPWSTTSSSDAVKTITVTGETTIEATPDEFTFYPYFRKEGTDKDALREELVSDANAIVNSLKDLGVAEEQIQLDASSYDAWYWQEDEEGILTVNLTITTKDDDQAQAIQDYLLTTDAEGQLTPQTTFSDEKQKELDALAVEQAAADAKEKAAKQAELFGAELGDVQEISQGRDSIFGGYPIAAELDLQRSSEASLPVLPGQDDYRQTVVVVYELKQ